MDRGGPAHKAGVEEGDIICAVDGRVVDCRQDLATSIHEYRPGDEAVVTLVRRGLQTELRELQITVGRDWTEQGEMVAHLRIGYASLGTEVWVLSLERGSRA